MKKARNTIKIFISLLLALCLVFCFTSCGTKDVQDDENQTGQETDINSSEGSDSEANTNYDEDGNGFIDDKEVIEIEPDDIDPEEMDVYVPFDFGAKFAVDFPFASTISKVDYTDISKIGDKIQSTAEDISSKAGKNFEFFNDYEADDGGGEVDIDSIVYAVGMEENNETLDYMETGVFHSLSDSKFVQYCVYISSNFYTIEDAKIDSFIDFAGKNLGVTFDKAKLVKAIETALDKVVELEEVYVNQTQIVKGPGYSDKVTLSVQSFEEEDGNYLYYIDVDRERTYN